MPTHLDCVAVDAAEPMRLGRFWSRLLGWPVAFESLGEVAVAPPPDAPGWPVLFLAADVPKAGKNPLHLDLSSTSADGQADTVRRALDLGAAHVDIGQGDVPWVVLADPEGNEFCVLEPRDRYADTGPVAAVVLDAADTAAQARFWAAALGWSVVDEGQDFASLRDAGQGGPWFELVRVPDPGTPVKGRVHVDVAPGPADDQQAEVARLRGLGARPADVGQRQVSWVVLADPEGNEFCVLTPR